MFLLLPVEFFGVKLKSETSSLLALADCISDSVMCMKQGIEFYTDEGRFSIAAKHQKELAELYEDQKDLDNAIASYQTAADFYEGEGSASSANQCLLKVALFSAQLERYDKAIELYEQIATQSIDNNLLKWSVKDYFLRAGLCHLAKGDIVAAKRALERYTEMDATFSSQRECKFLQVRHSTYDYLPLFYFFYCVALTY